MRTLYQLLRSMRPRHWVKNLFVLAPLIFAHRLLEPESVGRAVLAFLAFCLGASAVYLINDLRDRDADRLHPVKRRRPIASGELGLPAAILGAGVCGALALGLGLLLGLHFLAVLALYLGLNALYSWRLKEVVILDVMIVAAGFVLRVEGGAAAIDVALSSWLLLCTIFIALFLALSKRRHELVRIEGASSELSIGTGASLTDPPPQDTPATPSRPVLAHYGRTFLDQMINVVTASSVVCYALYTMSEESIAKHGRGLVATVPFVLFGVFRYLYLLYQRPDTVESPTEELLTDLPFVVNLALWGLAVVIVLYG